MGVVGSEGGIFPKAKVSETIFHEFTSIPWTYLQGSKFTNKFFLMYQWNRNLLFYFVITWLNSYLPMAASYDSVLPSSAYIYKQSVRNTDSYLITAFISVTLNLDE